MGKTFLWVLIVLSVLGYLIGLLTFPFFFWTFLFIIELGVLVLLLSMLETIEGLEKELYKVNNQSISAVTKKMNNKISNLESKYKGAMIKIQSLDHSTDTTKSKKIKKPASSSIEQDAEVVDNVTGNTVQVVEKVGANRYMIKTDSGKILYRNKKDLSMSS